jgi:hypothetical protein
VPALAIYAGSTPPGLPPAGPTRIPVRRLHLTVVAIAPDLGERYLDTYQSNWVRDSYGE